MKTIACLAVATTILSTNAFAAETLSTLPSTATTVTNYYKQAVYDPKENKIGDIDDVLVDKDGRITALVIGVGGFLGVGEKDVAVPFSAVKGTKKDNKWWLTLNETKDSLKKAVGFKYNKETTSWSVDKK
jgi:sporulation protein YlmC with PRC-barrel domain